MAAIAAGLAATALSSALSFGVQAGTNALQNNANKSLQSQGLKQQYEYNSKLLNQNYQRNIDYEKFKMDQLQKAGIPAAALYTRGDRQRFYLGNGSYTTVNSVGTNTPQPGSVGVSSLNMFNPLKFSERYQRDQDLIKSVGGRPSGPSVGVQVTPQTRTSGSQASPVVRPQWSQTVPVRTKNSWAQTRNMRV